MIGGAAYTLGILIIRQWSLFDFAKSVIIGGISGALTSSIGEVFKMAKDANGILQYTGKFAKSLKGYASLVQAGMHGISQGITSMLGSDGAGFFQGFVSGALGSLGAKGWAGMIGEKVAANGGMIAFGALAGGIGAELSGGNFFKGFVIGGSVAYLNEFLHTNNKIKSKGESYTIDVNRIAETEDSTIDTFTLKNSKDEVLLKGTFLEPKGPSTTTSNTDSRIPEGKYKGEYYGYDKNKGYKYVIFNKDVPYSRLIEIHVGNFPKDTFGCFLIGDSYSIHKGNYMVGNSRNMNLKLYQILGKGNFNFNVTSSIKPK